jgi:hypothetical protein
MRRFSVRRRSKKCAQRAREAKPIRDGLRASVGRCELCGKRRVGLDVHEIARGTHRQKALDKPFALLVVCRVCHEKLDDTKAWPEARQLAVLKRRRPGDFNLAAYLSMTSPQAPLRIEPWEVEEWK